MKKYIALTLGVLMLFPAVSCRRERMTPEEARDALKQEVVFTASMDGYQVKAADTSFDTGDAIGIYAMEPFNVVNVKATVSGSSVTPAKPIQWELVRSAIFFAYYPYTTAYQADPKVSFTVRTDQAAYDAYKASDLRGAVAQANNGETVALQFRHMLSKLTVVARSEDGSDPVASVTVGGVATKVSADFSVPSVDAASGKADIKACGAVSTDGFAAILVPQSLQQLPITVTTRSGRSQVFQLDKPTTFDSGCAYTTTQLTVAKQQGAASATFSVSITNWGDGGSMDFHKGKQTN